MLTLDNEEAISLQVLNMYIQGLRNFEIIKELQKDNYILCKDIGILAPKIFNNFIIYNPNTE